MVPEGWKLTTIGDHVDLLSGFPFKSDQYTDSQDDIPLLRGDNVGQGFLRWREAKRWSKNNTRGLERYFLRKGDFVIAMDRTWIPAGVKVSEVDESDLPCLLLQRVSRLRAKPSLEQGLLRQFFLGHRFTQHVKKVQTETAVPHISPADIREFSILLPPKEEQSRISEVLGTWDRAIKSVDKLIQNSQVQKRVLIQQLLTGKKRFPEFACTPWNDCRLSEVAQIIVSNVDKKSVAGESPVRLCNYMDVYSNDVVHSELPYMWATAPQAQIKKFGLWPGDVVITKDSETPDDIAVATYVEDAANDILCGYHLAIVRPNKQSDGRFLKFFFESPHTRYYFASRANGATRFGLTVGSIENAPICLPPIQEQKRIARIIADAEKETRLLLESRERLIAEKKALMQQVLTGKRRVRLMEAAA